MFDLVDFKRNNDIERARARVCVCVCVFSERQWIHFQWRQIYQDCFEKGSTLKGKNVLPMGANYFLLEYTPFQKGISVLHSRTQGGSHKSCLPCKNAEKLPRVSSVL